MANNKKEKEEKKTPNEETNTVWDNFWKLTRAEESNSDKEEKTSKWF